MAACMSAMHTAQAETPNLQVGAVGLKPYVLQQLDAGSTFDQSRGGGQAAGFICVAPG